jgi:hypothetical protein
MTYDNREPDDTEPDTEEYTEEDTETDTETDTEEDTEEDTCKDCSEPLDLDGYDGRCGNCADATPTNWWHGSSRREYLDRLEWIVRNVRAGMPAPYSINNEGAMQFYPMSAEEARGIVRHLGRGDKNESGQYVRLAGDKTADGLSIPWEVSRLDQPCEMRPTGVFHTVQERKVVTEAVYENVDVQVEMTERYCLPILSD